MNGVRSVNNSSSAALVASATFTGSGDYVENYSTLCVGVLADVAGTLHVDFSPDKSNWDSTQSFAVSAGSHLFKSVEIEDVWARVRYVNGGTDQASMRLSTVYKSNTANVSLDNSSMAVSQSGAWTVSVDSLPALASGTDSIDVVQSGSWTVSVDSLPALSSANDSVQVYGFDGAAKQPIACSADGELLVQNVSSSSGMANNINVSSTSWQVSAGEIILSGLDLNNTDGLSDVYFKVYDAAAVNPASDTPDLVYPVAINSSRSVNFSPPLHLANGCVVRAVTGIGHTDTTSPASNTAIMSVISI